MRDWPGSNNTDHTPHDETDHNHQLDHLHTLFTRLHPQEVEDFYSSYQQWLLQQRILAVQAQIAMLHLRISENTRELTAVEPSSTAQTVLARLYMHGVQDVDLLDRLLEHDDAWLDHTIELLELCEFLGFIQDNYTQWCEFALEGAYDWITSMDIIQQDQQSNQPDSEILTPLVALTNHNHISTESETLPQVTEEELLQKLMSEDDDETVKRPAIKLAELPPAHSSTTADTQSPSAQIIDTTTTTTPSDAQPNMITRPVATTTRPLPVLEMESPREQLTPNRDAEARISHASPSSSMMIASPPQRGPVWRLYNQLARRFFAT